MRFAFTAQFTVVQNKRAGKMGIFCMVTAKVLQLGFNFEVLAVFPVSREAQQDNSGVKAHSYKKEIIEVSHATKIPYKHKNSNKVRCVFGINNHASGNRMYLEIYLDSTGTDRAEAARLALALHGLWGGQAEVVFTNPSTEPYRLGTAMVPGK